MASSKQQRPIAAGSQMHENQDDGRRALNRENTPDVASEAEGNATELVVSSDEGRPRKFKVEWSGDEDSDPGAAYKRFKAHSKKRQSGAGRGRTHGAGRTVVGKRKSKRRAVESTYQPEEFRAPEGDEDETWEPELPAHLSERMESFKARVDQMQHAGLKLPPDFAGIDFSDDEHADRLAERPDFPTATPSREYKDTSLPHSLGIVPAPIAQWLRDYQIDGASFLHELFVYQKGGILGDDMGLGKTIQVIAFLTAAFGKTGVEKDAKRMRKMRRQDSERWYPRVLIVCPGSLMENWKNELTRWGWWHIDIYHGSTQDKETALRAAVSGRTEIVITTYETYRLQKDSLNLVDWDCCVADECHMIKGRRSKITEAMNQINALCRVGLTGTAIQNNYEELWTLLNWTNPGRFGPVSAWKQAISEPLKIGQAHDATVPQLAKARKTAKNLVNNLLPEFFLRRMKTLIAHQLPKKSDRVVFCPLTAVQAAAYETFSNTDLIRTIRESTQDCYCGSKKRRGWCCEKMVEFNGEKTPWQAMTFPAIASMQKLSNHLASLVPPSSDNVDKQERAVALLELVLPDDWKRLYNSRDNILNFANPEYCGKWKVLRKLLHFWHQSGDKVLIFSHSVRLLRMLQTLFNATTSYNVSYLDGSMSYLERAQAVELYNADANQFVFLISTRAGGMGLNITSANKVVIFDPNWNPSYDLQAQDRAYRIGQVRDVEVFRLISAGTVEEIVYARQVYKQQQSRIAYTASVERRYFRGVQDTKQKQGEIFGLANLFAFHGENVVLRDIVNKTNVAESKAGVSVVGLDLSQDDGDGEEEEHFDFAQGRAGSEDGEDSAMSQLAALISEGGDEEAMPPGSKTKRHGKARSDPVQAILSKAGVSYTHENSEVIGTSKVESRLSRRAEETGKQASRITEHVFASDSQRRGGPGLDGVPTGDIEHIKKLYGPPDEVRRRQFCTMAVTFGFGGDTKGIEAFAAEVEGWSQGRRRAALDRFYELRSQQQNSPK